MALFRRAAEALIGGRLVPDAALLRAFPELGAARYRRGGLPPRVGGWFLGARTVDGIALGRTVWVAPDADLTPALLLHEVAHVAQWRSVRWFALRYVWESLRHGYLQNRYELEAHRQVHERLRALKCTTPMQSVVVSDGSSL